jgi:hypothetical protein
MTDLKKAAQQALEALEDACGDRCNAEYNPCWQREVAETLRTALAEPSRAQQMTEAGYTRRPTLREMAEPLTEEEIDVVLKKAREDAEAGWPYGPNYVFLAIRGVEAAHGIKENT